MPRSAPIELLSFRRTFALLMVLVAVPSAGLTGLGVVAMHYTGMAAINSNSRFDWDFSIVAPRPHGLDPLL